MPTFVATLDPHGVIKGADEAKRAVAGLGDSFDTMQKRGGNAVSSLDDSISRLTKTVLGLASAYKAMDLTSSFVRMGVEANASLETASVGLAAVLTATMEIRDSQGRMLQGQEKFNAALAQSKEISKAVDAATKSAAASELQLMQALQATLGIFTAQGGSIQENIKFLTDMSNAMAAFKLDMNNFAREASNLLSGRNLAQSAFFQQLKSFGISEETVKSWVKAGTVIENLSKTMEGFGLAGEAMASTFHGVTRDLGYSIEGVAQAVTGGLTASLRDAKEELSAFMYVMNDQKKYELTEQIKPLVELGRDIADVFGDAALSGVRSFTSAMESAGKFISEHRDTLEAAVNSIDDIVAAYATYRVAIALTTSAQSSLVAGIRQGIVTQDQLAQSQSGLIGRLREQVAIEQRVRDVKLEAAKVSVRQAQLAQTEQAWRTQQIDTIAKHTIGTKNEERAVAMLEVQRQKLLATDKALAAAERELADAQRKATVSGAGRATVWDGIKSGLMGIINPANLTIMALTAAGTAAYSLATSQSAAEKVAQKYGNTMEEVRKTLLGMGEEAEKAAEKITDAAKALAQAQLQKDAAALKDVLTEIKLFDIGSQSGWGQSDALREGISQIEELQEELRQGQITSENFIKNVSKIGKELRESGDATDKFNTALATLIERAIASAALEKNIQNNKDVLSGTAEVADKASTSMKALADATTQAGNAFAPKTMAEAVKYLDDLYKNTDALKNLEKQRADEGAKHSMAFLQQKADEIAAQAVQLDLLAKDLTLTDVERDDAAAASRDAWIEVGDILQKVKLYKEAAAEAGATAAKKTAAEIKKFTDANKELKAEIEDYDLSPLEQQARKIEREYTNALEAANKLTNAKERAAAIENADLEKKKALLDLDKKMADEAKKEADKEAKRADERRKFYKEYADLANDYGLSLQLQNDLIGEQVKELRRLEIPEEYIQQWEYLTKLQNSRDFEDGVTRAYMKYEADVNDVAARMESTFSGLFNGIDSSMTSMWQGLIDEGKVSMSSLKSIFSSFLADLAHMAITRPIALQFAGAITGLFGGATNANAGMLGGLFGGGASGADYAQLLADYTTNMEYFAETGSYLAGMPTSLSSGAGGIGGFASGVTGIFSDNTGSILGGVSKLINPSTYTSLAENVTSGFSYISSLAESGFNYLSSLFSTAATDATVSLATETSSAILQQAITDVAVDSIANSIVAEGAASTATSAASTALSALAGIAASVGAGFTGYSLGSYAGAKIMGNDKANTVGAQDGGKIGAGIGAAGGFATGVAMGVAGGATIGASIGSVVPVVGTLIGAAIGTIAGMLAGAGDVRKPTMRATIRGYLGHEEGMDSPYSWLNLEDPAMTTAYFGKDFTKWRREDRNPRTFINQGEFAFVGTSGEHLGGSQHKIAPIIDEIGVALLSVMEAANTHALATGEVLNTVGNVATVLNDDLSYNTDEWKSLGIGDAWLEQLRQIEVMWDGKKTGSKLGQKGLDDWTAELTKQVENTYIEAFSKIDLSSIADRFDIDQSSYEGFTRFTEAVSQVNSMLLQTAALYEETPVTQVQEQVVEMLQAVDEQYSKMVETGVNADYAGRLVDDFLYGSLQKFIVEVDKGINPASELAQSIQQINAQFEDLRLGAEMLGAASEDLIRIERLRLQSVEQMRTAMLQPIYQDFNLRTTSLMGGDTTGLQLQYTHQQQRTDMISKVGADSPEMKALLAIQEAERLAHEAGLAQATYDKLASELAQMESSVKSATAAIESARLAFVHELIAALDTAYNGIQQAVDAWHNGAKSAFDSAANEYASSLQSSLNTFNSLASRLRQTHLDLLTDSTLSNSETSYAASKSELDRLYTMARGGDADAASDLAGVAKTFLNASYAAQSDYGAYLRDFATVRTMLAALEAEAQAQADGMQTELDVLQEQYGIAVKNNKTLAELKDAMVAAHLDFQEAETERQAAYQRWGFEDVVPGIEGLKVAYYDAVTAYEKAQQDIRDAILAGITTQGEIDSLRVVNKLDELKAQMAAAQAEQATYSQELIKIQAGAVEAARIAAEAAKAAALAAAGEADNAVREAEATSKPGIYGSKYATEYDLLAAKAASLNRGEYFGSDIDPNIVWTATTVKEGMSSEGMTVAEWYERHGKLEGFATGGIATPGWRWVGERGRELMYSGSTDAIFDHRTSTRLADMPDFNSLFSGGNTLSRALIGPAETDGSPGATRALLAELQAQNAGMRTQIDKLNKIVEKLTSIDRHTRRSSEQLEFMAEDSGSGQSQVPIVHFPE